MTAPFVGLELVRSTGGVLRAPHIAERGLEITNLGFLWYWNVKAGWLITTSAKSGSIY